MVAQLVCHGCGAVFDPRHTLACSCPNAVNRDDIDDDIDHVLEPKLTDRQWPEGDGGCSYLRYRQLSLASRLIPDAQLVDIISSLDDAVAAVDGHGFEVTPCFFSEALGCLVKDETNNVSGSHKGRHLMGVMIYLKTLVALGRLSRSPLAIASCGNAAMAAAVIARAADWPLQIYVPTDAGDAVLHKLATLGAQVTTCPRDPTVPGDPAVHAFREALRGGALPFSVQGDVCGVAVEGGRTLGWELADQALRSRELRSRELRAAAGCLPDHLFIQVGGGALASAVWQGLRDAMELGVLDRLPHLHTVQTEGAWPLRRAWQQLGQPGVDQTGQAALRNGARHRAAHMWPWETPPHSIAHGILDDETYDWWACCQAMAQTGGQALVVSEDALIHAQSAATKALGRPVSHTGSAGLAGLQSFSLPAGQTAAVILTGRG